MATTLPNCFQSAADHIPISTIAITTSLTIGSVRKASSANDRELLPNSVKPETQL